MLAVKFRVPYSRELVTKRDICATYRTLSNKKGLLCYDKRTDEFKFFAVMVLTERGVK
jgi:hypothetical protein